MSQASADGGSDHEETTGTFTSTALALTALTIGGIVGASVLAGAAEEATVISACYSNSTGAVRIVATDEQCHPNEPTIQWNQTGPSGPAGPAGPAGPPGPEGPPGPGLTGIERVWLLWDDGPEAFGVEPLLVLGDVEVVVVVEVA